MLVHVADETGKKCKDCEYSWWEEEKSKGLIVPEGTLVEVEGIGEGRLPDWMTVHPLKNGDEPSEGSISCTELMAEVEE